MRDARRPNQLLQATPVGAVGYAGVGYVVDPAWLSLSLRAKVCAIERL